MWLILAHNKKSNFEDFVYFSDNFTIYNFGSVSSKLQNNWKFHQWTGVDRKVELKKSVEDRVAQN